MTGRSGTLGTPLRLSEDSIPEMIRNRNGSPVAKAVSRDVALTLVEYANERDALKRALSEIAEKARWYAENDARDAQEVDHALCVEVLDIAEKAFYVGEAAYCPAHPKGPDRAVFVREALHLCNCSRKGRA